jgi:hypothetical protein
MSLSGARVRLGGQLTETRAGDPLHPDTTYLLPLKRIPGGGGSYVLDERRSLYEAAND